MLYLCGVVVCVLRRGGGLIAWWLLEGGECFFGCLSVCLFFRTLSFGYIGFTTWQASARCLEGHCECVFFRNFCFLTIVEDVIQPQPLAILASL